MEKSKLKKLYNLMKEYEISICQPSHKQCGKHAYINAVFLITMDIGREAYGEGVTEACRKFIDKYFTK